MRGRDTAYILGSFGLLVALALTLVGALNHHWVTALIVCAIAVVGTGVAFGATLRESRRNSPSSPTS